MLLMERVRDLGADQAEPSEESVRRARAALATAVSAAHAPRGGRRRARVWTGLGIGGLTAGAAVVALGTGGLLFPVMPDAAAAAVLEQAASVTVDAQDLAPGAGQYIRIETVDEFVQFWDGDAADDGDDDTFAFNASRDTGDAAVLVRDTRVLYVPADRSADWFYDWGNAEVVRSFGAQGTRAAQEWPSSPGAAIRERGTVQVLPGGAWPVGDGDPAPVPHLADGYRPYYEEMPREPSALRDWLRARSGLTGAEGDRWVVASLSDPSAINLMPAELRAAFFRAIALIPGFELVDEGDGTATLRYAVPGHRTTTIVVDTDHGLVDSIAEGYGSGGVIGDTPESTTSVVTEVVDEVP